MYFIVRLTRCVIVWSVLVRYGTYALHGHTGLICSKIVQGWCVVSYKVIEGIVRAHALLSCDSSALQPNTQNNKKKMKTKIEKKYLAQVWMRLSVPVSPVWTLICPLQWCWPIRHVLLCVTTRRELAYMQEDWRGCCQMFIEIVYTCHVHWDSQYRSNVGTMICSCRAAPWKALQSRTYP